MSLELFFILVIMGAVSGYLSGIAVAYFVLWNYKRGQKNEHY